MPEFQLVGRTEPTFTRLDSFTRGYIEALFFCETEPTTDRETHDPEKECEGQISALPGDAGVSDLTPRLLREIKEHCAAFQRDNGPALARAYVRPGYDPEQAGRDFWFTRNGHGVGYWDREQLEAAGLGEQLSEAARKFGQFDVFWNYEEHTVEG